MLDYGDGTVVRYTDKNAKWLNEALTMPAPRAGGPGGRGGGRGGGAAGDAAPAPPADLCAAIGTAAAAGAGRAAGSGGES